MSRKHAERYTRQGRGEFVGSRCFRFYPNHRLHKAAIESAEAKIGYDSRKHGLSLREMHNVPIINPTDMLAPSGRINPGGRNGRVRVVIANGVRISGDL